MHRARLMGRSPVPPQALSPAPATHMLPQAGLLLALPEDLIIIAAVPLGLDHLFMLLAGHLDQAALLQLSLGLQLFQHSLLLPLPPLSLLGLLVLLGADRVLPGGKP